MINGVFCHETGCPNSKKTWIDGRGWILFLKCRECGDEMEAGEECSCQSRYDDDDSLCTDVRCALPADHTGPCEPDEDVATLVDEGDDQ